LLSLTKYEKFCVKITTSTGAVLHFNLFKKALQASVISDDVTQSINHNVGRTSRENSSTITLVPAVTSVETQPVGKFRTSGFNSNRSGRQQFVNLKTEALQNIFKRL